jgi:hypothetical protein
MRVGKLEAYGNGVPSLEIDPSTGIVDFDKQSRCKVYLGSDQTISNDSWTKVEFDTEVYDNQSEFDPTTNYRFTAKKAGYYLVTAQISFWTANNAISYLIGIHKNGGNVAYKRLCPGATELQTFNITDILYLDVNNYVEIYTWQNSGGDEVIIGQDPYSYVSIHKLS